MTVEITRLLMQLCSRCPPLTTQLAGQVAVNRHAQRLIRAQLGGVDESVKLLAAKRFAAALPAVSSKAWGAVLATLIDKVANAVRGVA